MQIETTDNHFISRLAQINKTNHIKHEDRAKELLCSVDANVNWYVHFGDQSAITSKNEAPHHFPPTHLPPRPQDLGFQVYHSEKLGSIRMFTEVTKNTNWKFGIIKIGKKLNIE